MESRIAKKKEKDLREAKGTRRRRRGVAENTSEKKYRKAVQKVQIFKKVCVRRDLNFKS